LTFVNIPNVLLMLNILVWLQDISKMQAPAWDSYPYNGTESQWCHISQTSLQLNFKNIYEFKIANEDELRVILANYGPVVVTMYVSPSGLFQNYRNGVFYDFTCPTVKCTEFNHGMLLVGYGVDQITKAPFWLVKNSW
jgi:C1A family cysteine protease